MSAVVVAASAGPPVAQAATAVAGDYDFTVGETVNDRMTVPWGIDFFADGRAVVGERTGRVWVVEPGAEPQDLGVLPGVVAAGEGGLLGLAISPAFDQDQYIYAYLTSANDNRIVRFRETGSPELVLGGLARSSIHNGGQIAFGPDGLLYAAVGDANVPANAQDLNSRNGKILRMTPTGEVPADNPFGTLVYSYGHRNVQGLAWDSEGRLFATEFGQNTWDEINRIEPGVNYGWPVAEGTGTDPAFRNPLVVWRTAEASPSGATIVNNIMYVGALRGTRIWVVPLTPEGEAGTPVAEAQGLYGRLRGVAVAPDGALWVTTSNRDGRGTPVASDDRVLRFRPTS